MSAYIVEKNHVLYLVCAALSRATRYNSNGFSWYHAGTRHEIGDGDVSAMAETANMLWRENIKSVSARYPHESSATLPGTRAADFIVTEADFPACCHSFDPVQVLKACNCFDYQSCEHDEWRESLACAFIQALKEKMMRALPTYDDAEWGAPTADCWQMRNVISLSALARRHKGGAA